MANSHHLKDQIMELQSLAHCSSADIEFQDEDQKIKFMASIQFLVTFLQEELKAARLNERGE